LADYSERARAQLRAFTRLAGGMMAANNVNREQQPDALLRELSPHQIARMIRSLDSRLISISYDDRGDAPVLVYSFEVAGKQQAFPVVVDPTTLISIVDLYPEAAGYERALQRQFGLRFRKCENCG
jgi:hypothetical protein